MSKQRPTPDKMINDLSGASAFFKGSTRGSTPDATPSPISPSPETAPAVTPPTPQANDAETNDQPVRPGRDGRDGRPQRRMMIRHPFEIYADQLEGLRELADQVRRTGENGSMSKMVRDAIDQLLSANDGDAPTR